MIHERKGEGLVLSKSNWNQIISIVQESKMKKTIAVLLLLSTYCIASDADKITDGKTWSGSEYKEAIKGKVTLLVIWGG